MKRFNMLHWAAFILIIIALLWLTISYYSLRVIPYYAFLVLFAGVFLLILAEYRRSKKKVSTMVLTFLITIFPLRPNELSEDSILAVPLML